MIFNFLFMIVLLSNSLFNLGELGIWHHTFSATSSPIWLLNTCFRATFFLSLTWGTFYVIFSFHLFNIRFVIVKLLTLTIHKALWGTLIYQEWIHLFNMVEPTSLKLLGWMTLHKLPLELHPFDVKIVPQIDKVLGIDSNDLQFCIALALEEIWMVHFFIMGKHVVLFIY